MTELKLMLKDLCEADGLPGITDASDTAEKYLSQFAKTYREGNNVIGKINGNSDYTIMLDAHIDEVGMMVTGIKEGFLTVASVGGIDHRMLAGMKVRVHGKKTIRGVFCSIPPHLRDKENKTPDFSELYIDTGLGDKLSEIVSLGDRVTYHQSFKELLGTKVMCKSLDDRAGVAALIRTAELLKDCDLPCNVVFLLSDMEEIGGDGAKIKSYSIYPDEAIAVDVSFGFQPGVKQEESGELGKGAMLGISPILSKEITNRLEQSALNINVMLQKEVMGGKTGTNADHISVTRQGVPSGLLSIPLKNMHTPVEIIDVKDIENTAEILAEYIKSKRN